MKVLRLWGPVIIWMALIFFGSTRERVMVSPEYTINFLFFKTLHVLEYALLYILTFRATKNAVTSFIIVVSYASSDEIHQLFVPSREGTVRDVIIDALGAGAAWMMITKLLPKMPKRLKSLAKNWLDL